MFGTVSMYAENVQRILKEFQKTRKFIYVLTTLRNVHVLLGIFFCANNCLKIGGS
jgi:hypothetical protein